MKKSAFLSWPSLAVAVLCFIVFPSLPAGNAQSTVANMEVLEGSSHAYLAVRDASKKVIASGELTQVQHGKRIVARLVFRFRDGSIDDETTIFTQDQQFHLISDRHIQKGPSFPDALDALIETQSHRVTLVEPGKERKVVSIEFPPDLSNGLVLTTVRHMHANMPPMEMPYLAESAKPRLVKVAISQDGDGRFRVGPTVHRAVRYVIKIKLGGVAGVVAPVIGKQPADSYVWVAQGAVPAVVRVDTALFEGGPIWSIQPASPVWE